VINHSHDHTMISSKILTIENINIRYKRLCLAVKKTYICLAIEYYRLTIEWHASFPPVLAISYLDRTSRAIAVYFHRTGESERETWSMREKKENRIAC